MLWTLGLALAGAPDADAIEDVLDALHKAAAEADAETYFGLYTDDAVFVGTDPEERWDLDAFRAYAAPHFEAAPAWTYTPAEREVHIGPKGRTAWFYETLDHERYGRVRGSGALVVHDGHWRIAQYVLSFPVPNDRAAPMLAVAQGSPTLPTPFTADRLRAGHPEGLSTRWRRSSGGEEPIEYGMVVARSDAEGVAFQNDDGSLVEATWAELRDHAAFPIGATTWTDEVPVTVEAGTFVTRRYEVRGDGDQQSIFWFDLDVPGPPVKMEVRVGGDITETMELLERVLPDGTGRPMGH